MGVAQEQVGELGYGVVDVDEFEEQLKWRNLLLAPVPCA